MCTIISFLLTKISRKVLYDTLKWFRIPQKFSIYYLKRNSSGLFPRPRLLLQQLTGVDSGSFNQNDRSTKNYNMHWENAVDLLKMYRVILSSGVDWFLPFNIKTIFHCLLLLLLFTRLNTTMQPLIQRIFSQIIDSCHYFLARFRDFYC